MFPHVEVLSHINLNVLDRCVLQHGGVAVSHQSECVRPWRVFQRVELLSHISQNVLDCGVCFSMWRCCHISLNVLDLCVFQHGGGAVTHQSVLWISSTCTTSPQLPTVIGQLTETKRRERSETRIVVAITMELLFCGCCYKYNRIGLNFENNYV